MPYLDKHKESYAYLCDVQGGVQSDGNIAVRTGSQRPHIRTPAFSRWSYMEANGTHPYFLTKCFNFPTMDLGFSSCGGSEGETAG